MTPRDTNASNRNELIRFNTSSSATSVSLASNHQNQAESHVTASASMIGQLAKTGQPVLNPKRLRENKPVNNGERAGQGQSEKSGNRSPLNP